MKQMTAVSTMCAISLCAGIASAQTTTTQPGTTTPPVAGRAPLGTTVIEMEAVVLGWSVKKDLVDKNVVNEKREKIGKIEDLIMSPDKEAKRPHASYAIIGVGGFLGMGRRDVAIPIEQIKRQDGTLMLEGATKDALKGLPEFKYAKR